MPLPSDHPSPLLIEGVLAASAAAGWTLYETEDGWRGARRPQHELDYIHSLASPAAAQKLYLYAARDMIARNQCEQALADVRAVLATEADIDIDGDDNAFLAEALYRKDSWWEDPPPKVHPKFGARQTSPYARLRRAFRREKWKRRMDGQLPRLVHGAAALIAMDKVALARRSAPRVDWPAVSQCLDQRTAGELEAYLDGGTVAEMGLTNYVHFQRRWPRIKGLVLRHYFPED